ncbi:hypothetical protein SVA_0871 [Sulfurifustis variabilis]|uniref:Yip1 domain-containing protein n=1 Tax=Sulfurifustis variabilis TaxID=1675686 RepID=A0A1B4V1T9_9GAMM|nr:YIP1 family protein [Sulfurifustis variabilis]BAU47450.1 hypothetical protein SVA_0871 [Sulfurifustis variabilis]
MSFAFAPSPWLAIWLSPRATVRRLLDGPPRHREHILGTLFAISDALGIAVLRNWGDGLDLEVILLIAVGLAPVRMVFYLYMYPALAWLTGRWLGGQASLRDIRIATAWSFVPALGAALLWIPEIALFGDELFMSEHPTIEGSPWLTGALYAFVALEVVGLAWFGVVFLAALAEAQRFAVWRAVASVALAVALLVGPIYFGLNWLAGGIEP